MYPMKLKPATKSYIWGGSKLKNEWNKESENDTIAESWELSCHKDGESVITNGEFAGETLSSVIENNNNFLGEDAQEFPFFPILIKLIDAKTNLSIQVHPSDAYALKNEGQFGKSEMWYIVDAEPKSGIYCGFKEPVTMEEVADALRQGKIIDLLNFIEVKKGDTVYIPAGTVHAICGGLLICEVQQNSSLTYRLYDYDRTDANGKKRELHIDKSLKVIDSSKVCKVNEEVMRLDDKLKLLASCKYFTVTELVVDGQETTVGMSDDSFASITVVEGFGTIEYDGTTVELKLGDTCFIPASENAYTLCGKMKIIEARV